MLLDNLKSFIETTNCSKNAAVGATNYIKVRAFCQAFDTFLEIHSEPMIVLQ